MAQVQPDSTGDLCPVPSRARLSYRRTPELLAAATRPLADPEGRGGVARRKVRVECLTAWPSR